MFLYRFSLTAHATCLLLVWFQSVVCKHYKHIMCYLCRKYIRKLWYDNTDGCLCLNLFGSVLHDSYQSERKTCWVSICNMNQYDTFVAFIKSILHGNAWQQPLDSKHDNSCVRYFFPFIIFSMYWRKITPLRRHFLKLKSQGTELKGFSILEFPIMKHDMFALLKIKRFTTWKFERWEDQFVCLGGRCVCWGKCVCCRIWPMKTCRNTTLM